MTRRAGARPGDEMPLEIETFTNARGGNAFYKAVSHPVAARAAAALMDRLAAARKVAVYDPLGFAAGFGALWPLARLDLAGVFVQEIERIGSRLFGRTAQPVTDLPASGADLVLVAAFDAERLVDHVRHLVPAGAEVVTFDAIRLPDGFLTNRRQYLDPLNFATNFVFFRDDDGLGTRLVTANYWSGYGAGAIELALILFDGEGRTLAEWREKGPAPGGTLRLDSAEIRARFGLPAFAGQLFLHVVGAAGHDVVKYALDTFGRATPGQDTAGHDGHQLSATHDANSWPAEFYAGLPAPAAGERVTLWLQNSHPCAIPAGEIALNLMGDAASVALDRAIPPFASHPLDVGALLPGARWPQQIEVRAGKYMVRPRYEVEKAGRRRIAHVNVERTDLKPDPRIAELGNLVGKGFILPAPVLPTARWRSLLLPTPMARAQARLPIAATLYDRAGREIGTHRFGALERRDSVALAVDDIPGSADLPGGFGHVELAYDFAAGHEADGWLHALFRYESREGPHAAESSFGAHVFNTVLTFAGEPQSYAGRPPGLSTRLFLRLGDAPYETFCHLIYPASAAWRETSSTDLLLVDAAGTEVARRRVAIPCSGSLFWRYGETFEAAERARAGRGAYVVIRDTTCRLFGYHGLEGAAGAFSLDHMFGF